VIGQLYKPADLSTGKKPTLPVEYRKDGYQNCSGHFAGKKKSFAPAGNRTKIPLAFRKFRSRYGKNRGPTDHITQKLMHWSTFTQVVIIRSTG